MSAFLPYGVYWSTPFAKWQGSLANLNSVRLAAITGKGVLDAKKSPMERVDLGILGLTNPQKGSFYGLPWLTGMMGIDRVAGPTVQQACATSVRSLQMAPGFDPAAAVGKSNIEWLGESLFRDFLLPFEVAALILTVGLIAAVPLTLRHRTGVKTENPARQVMVRREDRVRLVKMDAERKGGPAA